MTTARTLPIAADHREFSVKINGTAVSRAYQLLSASITKRVNKISNARLVYFDGSASSSDFPISNSDDFVPGAEVEIVASTSRGSSTSLFRGLIVKQSIKVREHSAPQLVVECRHQAMKMTIDRRSAYYFDQTDADVIETLLANASIEADVDSTQVTHKQLVQYYSTDWDFLMSRAEANGLLVYTNEGRVLAKAPDLSASASVTLLFGATLLEFDAEIDSRYQYRGVKGVSWDAAQQAMIEVDATDPAIADPGNLLVDDLAQVVGLDQTRLQHTAISEEEAQSWANAHWMKSQLSRVSGRGKCEGIGTVNPGDKVTLSGVGDRYNGDVFVTGVRQEFDTVQGWKTHVQFGNLEQWFAEEHTLTASKASALLPGVNGLQIGVVVSNEDPDGEFRVRVKMPLVNNDDEGTWARVAALDAGNERGFFFRPEIGDEVVLGFFNDDPRQAVVLGMLHSSAKAAPLQGSDDNHEKMYQSRSGMKLYFDDDKKIIQLETPAGNSLVFSEEDQSIKMQDQNGNKIELTQDGIKIESSKALEMKAATEVKIESGTGFDLKGGSQMKVEGSAGVELSSSGVTKVKGSMVMIN